MNNSLQNIFKKETIVGLFVLIGIIAITYMAINLGNVPLFSDGYYTLEANFTDVAGLKKDAPIHIYGVRVGHVQSVEVDMEAGAAKVTLSLKNNIHLTDDAIVSVKTNGLIGDKILKISPGGVGEPLEAGDTMFETEPAIDIEDLISKYAFGDN